MTGSRSSIEALIFNAYSNLFDIQSVVTALEADLPGDGEFLTQILAPEAA
jgi:hypothetical protein